jgi:hypothetical protein
MIDHPDYKETLQECTTLAELLTSSPDLCEAYTSDLESQHNLSHMSILRLGQSIVITLWEHAYN